MNRAIKNIKGRKIFHHLLAEEFLKGFKKGNAHDKSMNSAKPPAKRISYRNPNRNALPLKGSLYVLNFKKKINR